jgi:hypothetical protein
VCSISTFKISTFGQRSADRNGEAAYLAPAASPLRQRWFRLIRADQFLVRNAVTDDGCDKLAEPACIVALAAIEASIDTSKPAIRRRGKTGQRGRGVETLVLTTASGPPAASRWQAQSRPRSKNPRVFVRRVRRLDAGAGR